MTRYHQRMTRALLLLVVAGCPHSDGHPRTYPEPKLADVVERLAKAQAALTSFRADSTMDYWLGSQRAKGEVLVMGTLGAKVRFAALSPAGGSTIAELACDGTNFVYVDQQNNCTLSGACDASSIARFFHIDLAPDAFVHLALGTPPIIANPTGTVTWDGEHGYEKVVLHGADGTEKLTIDVKDQHLDVIDAELAGADGKVRWSVANTDFVDVGGHRLPGKTRFKSPLDNEDLLVEWGGQREVDVELPVDKFKLQAPAGLAMCGQQAPTPKPVSLRTP